MLAPIYVIGHQNPDTDAIASAMGYAWLLRSHEGKNAIAARAGALNPQTSWVLKTLGLEPPTYMADASPRFERITRTLPPILPDRPLREAWAVASTGRSAAPLVDSTGKPLGLVTGNSVFAFLSRQLDDKIDLENVSVGRMLSVPARDAMDADVPRFPMTMRVADGRGRVLREERDDFFVVAADGTYYGICRTPDVLNPPRMQIILVDHNEPSQSIGALDEADLIEVLDHHRLGNPPTKAPIPFTVDPVGSTSTLVSERIANANLMPPPAMAGLLLAGLLSDTLVLKSPTTTERDRIAAKRLEGWWLSDGKAAYTSFAAFGEAVLGAGAGLAVRDMEAVVSSDLKIYDGGGIKFGVAQVEVASLHEIHDRLDEIREALETLRKSRGLALTVLMVTDVVRGGSRLVLSGQTERLSDLPYQTLADGTLNAPDLLSRKKQLLPTILGLLE